MKWKEEEEEIVKRLKKIESFLFFLGSEKLIFAQGVLMNANQTGVSGIECGERDT